MGDKNLPFIIYGHDNKCPWWEQYSERMREEKQRAVTNLVLPWSLMKPNSIRNMCFTKTQVYLVYYEYNLNLAAFYWCALWANLKAMSDMSETWLHVWDMGSKAHGSISGKQPSPLHLGSCSCILHTLLSSTVTNWRNNSPLLHWACLWLREDSALQKNCCSSACRKKTTTWNKGHYTPLPAKNKFSQVNASSSSHAFH